MQGEPPTGQVVGGYRLLRPLGQGAQSTVFLAEAIDGGQTVALKLIPLPPGEFGGDAVAAFERAARTSMRLVHPGIVRLYAHGIEDRLGWLAMELVSGGDLSDHVQPGRLLPPRQVMNVGARIAQALSYAHRQGVVHRDLKPANVLVDWPRDAIKVADLGLARDLGPSSTGTGIVPGTPAYMAPEQLAGSVPTPATDLYAFGVMLFQLLSGRLPHEATSMGELLRQVAREPAPDLRARAPQLPEPVAAAVASLLAKRPGERPADAETVARTLESLAAAAGAPGDALR